jgi:hypothetical protein
LFSLFLSYLALSSKIYILIARLKALFSIWYNLNIMTSTGPVTGNYNYKLNVLLPAKKHRQYTILYTQPGASQWD